MIDSIHSRYLSYLNQTSDQRDLTKTDFTYARSFGYRKDIKLWLTDYWLVPNMCRKSISFESNTRLTDECMDKLAKTQNYTNFSQEFEFNNKTKNKRNYNLFIFLMIFMAFGSIICLTTLSSIISRKYLLSFCETIRSENQINYLTKDMSDITDANHNINSDQNMSQCWNNKIDSGTFCLLMQNADHKPDLMPKYGRLELVRILSNEDQNSFTVVYSFKVSNKLNATQIYP